MTWLAILAVVAILIGINALYVGAEFATVSARRTRLAEMAAAGNRLAAWLEPIATDPRRLDAYVATCQVGITASSLLLGFYGQGQVAEAIAPLVARLGLPPTAAASLSATGVLLFLTGLQVIMGELVPKNVGVRFPERLAVLTALPMRWSVVVLRPFVVLFNESGRLILRLLGQHLASEGAHVHRPEEIVILAQESSAGGLLDPREQRLLENALRWREMNVRQAMVPRTQMLAAPVDAPRDEMLSLLAGSPHSRLPLYRDTVDSVVGVVHLKDLLCMPSGSAVSDIVREPPFVPATALAAEVFGRLQRDRHPVAIVIDEYGGTAGMVTLDDLVEALFGEIRDEFDTSAPPILILPGGARAQVRGDVPVRDLGELLNVNVATDEADSVGGVVVDRLGRLPEPGEHVDLGGLTVRVESMVGRAIGSISLPVTPDQVRYYRSRAR